MNTHPFFRGAIPALFLLSTSLFSQTAERPRAEAMVKEGVAFLKANGKDAFIAEVQKGTGRFHAKPGSTLYLFVYDDKAITLAHGYQPNAQGENRWLMKDPDGKFLIQEIIKAGQKKGGGWADYKFLNPKTSKAEEKTSFCQAEAGMIIGCGIYK
jgi:signal transduction histidine kinase